MSTADFGAVHPPVDEEENRLWLLALSTKWDREGLGIYWMLEEGSSSGSSGTISLHLVSENCEVQAG